MIQTGLKQLFVLVSILGLGNAEPPSNGYGTPIAPPISSYGTPNYQASDNGHNNHDYNGEPKSYEFGYQVKDEYTGTNYNQKETSDGNQVRGEYRVALPDGRIQIVTYWADWQSGYHADVRYEGEAHYPDQSNKNGDYGNGVSGQYGGYAGSASNSIAINNLVNGQDGYHYNNGYRSKSSQNNLYGAI